MIKRIILKNKLTVILDQNKSKYRVTANIYIKAGSLDNDFKIDGKLYHVNVGTAHVLEHYLIEQSVYGNIDKIFADDYISSNGVTSCNTTSYYMSTVHDFKKNFIKLLNIVNKPVFQEEKLDIVKKPIIQEIKMTNDRPGKLFSDTFLENIYQTKIKDIGLGTQEDLTKINIEDLKKFHQAFYRPENQIIAIVGNFDDDIIEIIEEEYKKFTFEEFTVEKCRKKEKPEVVLKYQEINDESIPEECLEIGYKIDFSSLKPIERNKLDYYFNYLFENNFSERTDLFNQLFKDRKISYSIEGYFTPNIIPNMLAWSFRIYTKNYNEVIKILQNQISNFLIDEKTFSRWKNNTIIEKINMEENFENNIHNLINNIFLYDLYEVDTMEFIKNLNIKECRRLLEKIDFSNYTILINEKKSHQ